MDVTCELDADGLLVVKLSFESVELNLTGTVDEFVTLDQIGAAAWESRSSIAAGSSAGGKAFWCSEGSSATILIGHDDETWDIAVTIPTETAQRVAALARGLKDRSI